jgi:hypothetical protein
VAGAGGLATTLDQEMLEVKHNPPVAIAARPTPDDQLPRKSGRQVSDELGGRYLLRYVLPHQVGLFRNGSPDMHWATPTPYSADETVQWLALPTPAQPRLFVMLLEPAQIAEVWGPRWVRFGKGIEYLLPNGFSRSALVFAWEVSIA